MSDSVSIVERLCRLLGHDETAVLIPNVGAVDDVLAVVERCIQHELPAGLKALYRKYDGELQAPADQSPRLFFGYSWLPLADAVSSYLFEVRWAKESARYGTPPPVSLPENCVQMVAFSPGWFPLTASASDMIAIDFSPGPNGTVGQVINFGRDVCKRRLVLAKSFDAFLLAVEAEYLEKRGHVRLCEDDGFALEDRADFVAKLSGSRA